MAGDLRARNRRRYLAASLSLLLWPLARVMPRRPGVWVFAYALGYKDNPRYLFEHANVERPAGVRPVWLAQSRAEAAAVRDAGFDAAYKRSIRGVVLSLRAGAVVLGSGPSEANRSLIGRAVVVQAWHGAPFKRLHNDFPAGDVLVSDRGVAARSLNQLGRAVSNASRARVDLLPAQSPTVSERFQSAFGIGPDASPVLGTPRADVIGRTGPDADAEAAAVRDRVLPRALASSARLVLYAPTWRDGRDESFLVDGLDIGALDDILERHDAVFLIRLHPYSTRAGFERAGLGGARRVILQEPGEDVDVNVLLRAVDVLVTDYSAISVDYALLGRPIVYFMPDLVEYEAGRGTYEPPSALTGGLHAGSWPELLVRLGEAFVEPTVHAREAGVVADRYFSFRDTGNCKRICDELARRVGLGDQAAAGRSRPLSTER